MAGNDFRKEVQERLTNENIHCNDQEKELVETLLTAYIYHTMAHCRRCKSVYYSNESFSMYNDPSREEYYSDRSEIIQKIESQLRGEILTILRETKDRSGCIGYCIG